MKQWVLDNRKSVLIAIAIYETLLGAASLVYIYLLLPPNTATITYLILIPIMALCIVSILAGIFYYLKGECRQFFLLSKLNFYAQLVQFTLAGLKFGFFYGPYLTIGVNGDANFLAGIGLSMVQFDMVIGSNELSVLRMNLFPLIPLIFLRWIERNKEQDPAETFLLEETPVS